MLGVYSEWVLKSKSLNSEGPPQSPHAKNVFMYSWGILFNLIAFWNDTESLSPALVFRGYGTWAWLLVMNQAFTGLLMAAVMLYLNSIVKLFMTRCVDYHPST